uniref:Uncharacterized protein n=1 Tax=Anguilla anguilla TaxID=7936 RepID=A0A0E9R1Y9_ANGAN
MRKSCIRVRVSRILITFL